jgi:hypothetical protein
MAFSQADLDSIDAAIVTLATSPEARVRLSDGREVEFRSASEALKVRHEIAPLVPAASGQSRIRQVRLYSRKF